MPTRLKSLELQGYKTFATRTPFEFPGTVTAIVGPNGSGKSNIADALRWVLGEQSYSLLRGKKTEDMIFAGSEQRPRAGMASVTVVFDNQDGWLPIDFSEVSVTRRAYRDGQNEYVLNGQKVRLRDVNELLSDSGLAERTYTIIGQGLVDTALSLKAEERRRLFEEAAGIGLHRSRREEALRRLDTTKRNLERVEDILGELRPRVRSLERQARKAEEYHQITADLREMLREWYGFHWHRAQGELSEALDIARERESELDLARQNQLTDDEQLRGAVDKIQQLRTRLNALHHDSAELHSERESISRELVLYEERLRSLATQKLRAESEQTRLKEEQRLLAQRVEFAEDEVNNLENEFKEASNQYQQSKAELEDKLSEYGKTEEIIQAARQKLTELTAHHAHLQARSVERRSQIERQQTELEEMGQTLSKREVAVQSAQNQYASSLSEWEQVVSRLKTAEGELSDKQSTADQIGVQLKEIGEQVSATEVNLARLEAHLDGLERVEEEHSGFAAGARLLLERANEAGYKIFEGVLSEQIKVPEALEGAISAILGDYVQAVLIENLEDANAALDILEGSQAQGALLPLNAIANGRHLVAPMNRDGVLGIAAELIEAPPSLKPAIDLLMANVLVVRDREAATALIKERGGTNPGRNIPVETSIVTLQGEVFYGNGSMIIRREEQSGVLSRQRRRSELHASRDSLKRRIERLRDSMEITQKRRKEVELQVSEAETQWADLRKQVVSQDEVRQRGAYQVDEAQRQLDWQIQQQNRLTVQLEQGEAETTRLLEEQAEVEAKITSAKEDLKEIQQASHEIPLDELRTRVSHWEKRAAVAERAWQDARRQLGERRSALENGMQNLQTITARINEISEAQTEYQNTLAGYHQEELVLQERIADVRVKIEPAEEELQAAEKEQLAFQAKEREARQTLSKAEHLNAQSKINLARKQEALDTLRHRVEDDFGLVAFDYADDVSGPTPLPLEGLVEQLPKVENLSDELEDALKQQRTYLRRLGPINPEARKEYHEVKERFEFMTGQIEDLNRAKIGILKVIDELDELMEREFAETFTAVAEEFHQIFNRIFGGGSARLLLTDPDDLTNTGIDIEARLPGRREQGLSLLSGGERSLTATALVFSLLRVSPTPFCVLDEVDAMLDEANVGRFRDLLRDLSRSTQFIIITHNRNTVQVAEAIYGITMGRDSTSQVISLKLDEVSQVME